MRRPNDEVPILIRRRNLPIRQLRRLHIPRRMRITRRRRRSCARLNRSVRLPGRRRCLPTRSTTHRCNCKQPNHPTNHSLHPTLPRVHYKKFSAFTAGGPSLHSLDRERVGYLCELGSGELARWGLANDRSSSIITRSPPPVSPTKKYTVFHAHRSPPLPPDRRLPTPSPSTAFANSATPRHPGAPRQSSCNILEATRREYLLSSSRLCHHARHTLHLLLTEPHEKPLLSAAIQMLKQRFSKHAHRRPSLGNRDITISTYSRTAKKLIEKLRIHPHAIQ